MPISLKWKIQFWHALILGLVLAALSISFYFYVKHHQMREMDQWLDQQIPAIIGAPSDRLRRHKPDNSSLPSLPKLDDARKPRYPLIIPEGWELVEADLPAIVRKHEEVPRAPQSYRQKFEKYYVPLGFYTIVLNTNTRDVEYRTENAPDVEIPVVRFPAYFIRLREGRYREIFHPNPHKTTFVGVDLATFHSSLTWLKLQIAGVALGIFAVSMGVGYVIISRFLSPLKRIQETTAKIAQGALSERIPETSDAQSTELIKLTGELNKTFEQLESLFQRQTRFTADASHELRTPLTALLAQLEYGRESQRTPEELTRILEVCTRSGDRIKHITEQLMELSRYDSKRVELEYEQIPLDAFLKSLVEEMEPYVQKNGSSIITDLKGELFECDPFRLHQVISNLVNNALQHNDAPIQIKVHSRIEAEKVVIEISDNGKGIQPENIEKLFDRFFQESLSRTKKLNRMNVGLGLSISQAIVQAHGGTLTVSSTPNVKTTFTISLPRWATAQEAAV